MKLFVTDAQLAALRLEMEGQARQHYYELLRMEQQSNDEARARIAEERPDRHAEFIAHLVAEVAFWRLQFAHERQRADVSIDQRLSERGLGPVTLPPRPTTPAPAPSDLLDELMKNAEFAAMGSSEGVPS